MLFRCESAILRSHWVLVAMDQCTRRIVSLGVHRGVVDGAACAGCSIARHCGASRPKEKRLTLREPIARITFPSATGIGTPSSVAGRRNSRATSWFPNRFRLPKRTVSNSGLRALRVLCGEHLHSHSIVDAASSVSS
jgi:hypothetical protein